MSSRVWSYFICAFKNNQDKCFTVEVHETSKTIKGEIWYVLVCTKDVHTTRQALKKKLTTQCSWESEKTHNALVEVPLDGDEHVAQCSAEVGGRVHVLGRPHVVAHLDQHVERVEAVHLVAQCDQAVQLRLDALEDLVQ